MTCPRCGSDNPTGQKFCGNCGAALASSALIEHEHGEALASQLATLIQHDIVRKYAHAPELEYIFKHALIQEATYNSLLVKQRKVMHERVALVLEQLYAHRLDELAPLLAQHFYAADDWARAAQYAMRAGDAALRGYALREALEQYQRALDALDKWPDAPPELLLDATLGWIQGAIKFRPHEELIARLTRAEQVARAHDEKRRLARILTWLANAHFANGSTTRAAPYLFENFKLASELGDERLSIVPTYYMAFFMVDSDPQGALVELEHVIEMARRLGNGDIEAHAIATKALAHGRLGYFALARQEAQLALAYSGTRSSPIPEADLYNMAGFVYLDMGDVERSEQYGQLGAQKAIEANAIECAAAGNLCVALSRLQKRQVPEAQQAFVEAIRLADFASSGPLRNMGEGGLALAQFIAGNVEAMRDLEAAHQNAQAIDDQYSVAMFAQMLGDIATQGGNFGQAEQYFAQALAYYRQHAMRPYIVRILQSLARLYEKQARNMEAQQARSESEMLMHHLVKEDQS